MASRHDGIERLFDKNRSWTFYLSTRHAGHLLMTESALDCSMGDKTQKEKHKKDLQHKAKRKAAEHEKQETKEAQHHPYPDTRHR